MPFSPEQFSLPELWAPAGDTLGSREAVLPQWPVRGQKLVGERPGKEDIALSTIWIWSGLAVSLPSPVLPTPPHLSVPPFPTSLL